ncbi:FAR1-related sequence 5-like protein, partial [Tanacetum coccineum]
MDNVETNLKPSKGHVFVSLNQAYDFYRHYGKLGRYDIKLGTEKTISPLSDKGKGKAVDDGSSGKGKNIDVSKVSGSCVKNSFRKNTSCKTGCLARMMVRKTDGDMFEVYGFVEEHNHPL